MISAFGAGGYLTGRMRRRAGDATADEVSARDGAHGLLVWATGALFGMIIAASGVGGLLSAGSSAVGSAVGTATDIASGAGSADYFANVMLRNGISGTLDAPEAEAGAPAAPAAAPGRVVDPSVSQEIAGIVARSVAEGALSDRDRAYLARLVAANSDLDEAAATARVDEVMAEIDDARVAALAVVEEARVTGVIVGFITAATLLISAIAAFLAAVSGGHHRDEGLGATLFSERR
jgi:hypothetical protein